MADLTTTLPQLTPPNAFEEAGGILLGRQPKREFELAEIQRKIEEAGLQQKASQEKRLQQDQRLKQFGALSTIAKVINSIGPAIPNEAKSAIAQKLADEATTDNLMVTDKRFFEALVNQPNELAKFLDNYSQAKQQGDDDLTALTKGNQNITDPEVQKMVSETFQKLVGAEAKQPKMGDLKAMAVQLEVGGKKDDARKLRDAIKDIEATPQGAESRIYDALVEKHTQLGASNPRIAAANEFLGFVGSRAFAGAGGRAGGEEATKENFPLDAEAFKWINPETGTPAKASLTRKQARESGFVPVAESAITAVATAKAALAQIKEYRSLVPQLLQPATGDIGKDIATVQANRLKLLLKAKGGDPAVKRLLGLQGGIATLARATGDTANIAVAEREMLKEFVLTQEDTIQSANDKLDQAERILRSVVGARGIPLPAGEQLETTTGKVGVIPKGLQ